MTAPTIEISGTCPTEFAGVREEFERNFGERGEVGAALVVYLGGEKVIDLCGGHRDGARSEPWEPDTLVNVYSTTKGWLAGAMNMLADRGELDLEAPVTRYWPEFGQNGKGSVLVRHLLTHQAGLPAPSVDVPDEAVYDQDVMAKALAESTLYWMPGDNQGYHAATFGWLNSEVLRRVTGISAGAFVREQIAGPLGADLWIGLPESEDARTAETLVPVAPADPSASVVAAAMADPTTLSYRVFNNPPRPPKVANTRRWRAAEIPSSNGHASADGLARYYAALGLGGELDGVRLMSDEAVANAAKERVTSADAILVMKTSRSLGFMLPLAEQGDPRGPAAFGHAGMGGSLGYADPEHRLGFGYVMNQMGPAIDLRSRSLSQALYVALAAR
jgi:CubicO group peptidase (beta-lactamase class C family)